MKLHSCCSSVFLTCHNNSEKYINILKSYIAKCNNFIFHKWKNEQYDFKVNHKTPLCPLFLKVKRLQTY